MVVYYYDYYQAVWAKNNAPILPKVLFLQPVFDYFIKK